MKKKATRTNNRSYEEFVKNAFIEKVDEALFEVATEFCDVQDDLHKEAMEEAIKVFMKDFYNL